MRFRKGRRAVAVIALALLGLLGASCSSQSGGEQRIPGPGWVNGPPSLRQGGPASAPNIVFVLTDDLTWNLLRFMPHVRALQRDGVTFSHYFVTDSLCCPSRASIFTGEFPHDHGVLDNKGANGGVEAFLANHDEDRTYAAALRSHGYQVGLFGKFLNLYDPRQTYLRQRPYVPPGWSAWDVPDIHGYGEFDYTLAVGRRLGEYGNHPADYLTSVLGAKSRAFIRACVRANRPFLAQVSTFSPHMPYVPAPRDAERFPALRAPRGPSFGHAVSNAPKWLAKIPPLTTQAEKRFDDIYRLRAQDVLSVDRMVGRLRAEVSSLGVADNTYFVFSSDNGLHLGEHDLRQGKGTAFDTDIRVPLVVAGPGVAAGSVVSQLAENIDLAPTFETLAGVAPPATVDGRSLVPQLHGAVAGAWRSTILIEHLGPTDDAPDPDQPVHWGGNSPSYEAIRTSRYLYVEYVDGEREFYDLSTDPYELENRYSTMPTSLRRRLHAIVGLLSTCKGTTSCWNAATLKP
jgi:arylsulfatase A-like enzyme